MTEKLEIHIIELKKLKVNNNQNVKQQKLIDWLKFILNPDEMEVSNMEGNEDIKAAKKVLEKISQDEKEREKAYLRDKYIRDMNTRVNEGYTKGKAEGKAEGESMGRLEEKIKIAKEMKKQGIENLIIAKVTKLTIEEVEKLN